MSDVFIGYSREDMAFVRRLHDALVMAQLDVWADWEDIPPSAEWWWEIRRGIEGSNAYLVVMSPGFWSSAIAMLELNYALQHHKRIIPIMHRDFGGGPQEAFSRLAARSLDANLETMVGGRDLLAIARDNWQEVARHNWIFFRDEDDFDRALKTLVEAISTDVAHIREHTRLLVRAREWERQNRSPSFLLRGSDLRAAEAWLAEGATKEPLPTDLHRHYLSASFRAERRRLRTMFSSISAVFLTMLGLAVMAFVLFQRAESQRTLADERAQTISALEVLLSQTTAQVAVGSEQATVIAEFEASATSVALNLERSQTQYRELLGGLMGLAATHGAEVVLPPDLLTMPPAQDQGEQPTKPENSSSFLIYALLGMVIAAVFIGLVGVFIVAARRWGWMERLAAESRRTALPPDTAAVLTDLGFEIELSPESIFISYSHTDWEEYVRPLVIHLAQNGFKVWVDQNLLRGGQNWRDEINNAVDVCKRMVLCISPDSMDSIWVKFEFQAFFPTKPSLVPVICRPTNPLPIELRGLQYIEYENFDELIRTLKRMAAEPLADPVA